MVRLYENGKPRNEIIREYDLTPLTLGKTEFSFRHFPTFYKPIYNSVVLCIYNYVKQIIFKSILKQRFMRGVNGT